MTLVLIDPTGTTSRVDVAPAPSHTPPAGPLRSRLAYAAAHVVPRTAGDNTADRPADIDWDTTLAVRRRLYRWGLGVADAMDTAQRGMGLDPVATRELVARSAAVAREEGGRLVVGVGTDHLTEPVVGLPDVVAAYRQQLEHAEEHGAGPVLMASRHLARAATSSEDYRQVYREVIEAATGPVVLHWLGAAFDPALAGYFGAPDWQDAAQVLLQVVEEHAAKVAGIKMSLLDAAAEVWVRDRLPAGVRMFTGDDFNYVGLIGGSDVPAAEQPDGSSGHSDALLGAFACLAPAASAALQALDAADPDSYLAVLGPTQALSRHVFSSPTYHYKTGVAFLSWLNGHQPAFQMIAGLHAARSLPHLSETVRLANDCGALEQPELAARRWHALLALNGIDS